MFSLAKQFSNPWVKAGIYMIGAITPLSRVWDGLISFHMSDPPTALGFEGAIFYYP